MSCCADRPRSSGSFPTCVVPPPRTDVNFWDNLSRRLVDDASGVLPCDVVTLTKELEEKRWPKTLVSNTMAFADGRWLVLRHGVWHKTARAK